MGIIRDALIGIALCEAVNYLLKTQSDGLSDAKGFSKVAIADNSAAGISQMGILNERDNLPTEHHAEPAFAAATDPDVPLTGDGSVTDRKDAWSNSLANDELRAPDS